MSGSLVQSDNIPVIRQFPKTCTPLANVAADDNTWNGSGDTPITLTENCVRFDVAVITNPAYLVFSASTTEPTVNGCIYPAGRHTFNISGPTYLHYKNATEGSNVTLGVNCWSEGR